MRPRSKRAVFHAPLLANLAILSMVAPLGGQDIDLSLLGTVHPGFRIDGATTFDTSGRSVSGAGDVNGDGLADLIVGAYRASSSYEGESYVVFGKTGGTAVDLAALGANGFRIDGADADDYSGFSVSGAGDVNSDGLADLIVGAFGADPGGDSLAGESYVVFGKTSATAVDLGTLGTDGFRIDGIDANDWSGFSVSGAGDVNGDGLADLIVGAYRADPGGDSSAGESYVVFGKTSATAVDLGALGSGGFRIDGIDASDFSGRSVSGAGDVNGDGLADLIVGAYRANSQAGESYVVFGKTSATAVDLGALGSGGFRIDGIGPADSSGFSVSGAGDVNGDGLADLIVGAHQAASLAGESYVVFGKTSSSSVDLNTLGSGGFRIDGIDANDYSGRSVSGAGDVNGDGLADLLVGAFRGDPGGDSAAGESYVVFGKTSGTAVDLGALGSDGFRIDGIDAGDWSGFSVSGAGDVNGDGLADLLVGAYQATPSGRSIAGESYVVFSPATPPLVPPSGVPASATYLATAIGGNAPRVAIGITGDGSDDSAPASRCWIDFADGAAVSTQTVTLTRSSAALSGGLSSANTASVVWEVSTDRTAWTGAAVTFRYTDAEIAGMTEGDLRLYKGTTTSGPWTEVATTVDVASNTATATVTSFSFFALGDEAGLPVSLDAFGVE